MWSGAAIHWFGRQDYELPDRRLRYLRFVSWSCVHRSRAVSSEGMDRRSGSSFEMVALKDARHSRRAPSWEKAVQRRQLQPKRFLVCECAAIDTTIVISLPSAR